MQIQWFPGHMHKAQKEIRQVLSGIDVVIEILDARIPYSSQNPLLSDIRGDKPCIRILNKHDLADESQTAEWQSYLESGRLSDEQGTNTKDGQGGETRVLTLGLGSQAAIGQIPALCRDLSRVIRETRPVHALIVGIPNVGKSTIINSLAGKKIARTGNEPAITKAQQRVDIGSGVVLRDTPGVLWPNLENANSGYRLAATGAIKDTATDSADVALFAIEFLAIHYADRLAERYDWESVTAGTVEPVSVLDDIGRKRGCIGRGGLVDLDRAARIVLADLRSGALGRISFETPDMMISETKEVLRIRREKEERKQEKETRRKKKKRVQKKT